MTRRSIPIAGVGPAETGHAPPLSPTQRRTLRAAAALVIPASVQLGVPDAGDEVIAADIERTMGRDGPQVMLALEKLDAAAGGPLAEQAAAPREAAGRWLRENEPALAATFANLVLACYYSDERVMRSLGLEPRPPYPAGLRGRTG